MHAICGRVGGLHTCSLQRENVKEAVAGAAAALGPPSRRGERSTQDGPGLRPPMRRCDVPRGLSDLIPCPAVSQDSFKGPAGLLDTPFESRPLPSGGAASNGTDSCNPLPLTRPYGAHPPGQSHMHKDGLEPPPPADCCAASACLLHMCARLECRGRRGRTCRMRRTRPRRGSPSRLCSGAGATAPSCETWRRTCAR